ARFELASRDPQPPSITRLAHPGRRTAKNRGEYRVLVRPRRCVRPVAAASRPRRAKAPGRRRKTAIRFVAQIRRRGNRVHKHFVSRPGWSVAMAAKRDLVSMLDVREDLVSLVELAGKIKNRPKAGEPYRPGHQRPRRQGAPMSGGRRPLHDP